MIDKKEMKELINVELKASKRIGDWSDNAIKYNNNPQQGATINPAIMRVNDKYCLNWVEYLIFQSFDYLKALK